MKCLSLLPLYRGGGTGPEEPGDVEAAVAVFQLADDADDPGLLGAVQAVVRAHNRPAVLLGEDLLEAFHDVDRFVDRDSLLGYHGDHVEAAAFSEHLEGVLVKVFHQLASVDQLGGRKS